MLQSTDKMSEGDRSSLGKLNDPNIEIIPGKAYRSNAEKFRLGKSWKAKTTFSIEEIKKLKIKLNETNNDPEKPEKGISPKLYLNELLLGSDIVIPSLEIPERDPELEKRLNKLRRKLEEKEYQRMTSNVSATSQLQSHPEDSIRYQIKQMNSVIIAVIQFVISLAAAFLFGFQGIELFVGPLDLAVRLLLGIAAAVIVGAAELYIMVVQLDSREEKQTATVREKKVQ